MMSMIVVVRHAHAIHLLLHSSGDTTARPLSLPVVLVVVMMTCRVGHHGTHHHGTHHAGHHGRGRGHATTAAIIVIVAAATAIADKVTADGISVGGADGAHLPGMDRSSRLRVICIIIWHAMIVMVVVSALTDGAVGGLEDGQLLRPVRTHAGIHVEVAAGERTGLLDLLMVD